MNDIDFSALSLQDALDLAILVEDEAKQRYEEFAEQMHVHHSNEVAAFFRFMADNEAKHGADLRERREAIFGETPARVDPSMLWDVEAPDLSEARAFMSTREALEVAMAAETKAFDFFNRALPSINDKAVRVLFTELRDEEVDHQGMVREQMEKLGPEAAVDPNDYVDPPTGM